jgi:hypothetical protein
VTYSRLDWLALLKRPFSVSERDAFLVEVRAFDELLARAVFDPSRATELTRARLIGSQTAALEPWVRANARMSELVRDDLAPTLERIAELNALVRDAEEDGPRTKPIHIGPYECPRPDDIAFLLEPLFSQVIERTERVHPIAGAALLEQWLATVHPFPDGNGRTARLSADWHLALHGYPPASYPSVRASFKAIVDHGGEPATPLDAATGLLAGLHHTLRILARGS